MPSLVIWCELIGICAVLAGWGFLLAQVLHRLARLDLDGLGYFELAVLGTVAVYLCAAVSALFVPLGGVVTPVFALAGLAGFLAALASRRQAVSPWALGSGLALSILTAAGTVYTPLNYDAGLYYLQQVRWLESAGAVLGLANVHTRLGFNSAIVPLSTIFDHFAIGRDGLFLTGPALFVVFSGAMFEYVAAGWRKGRLDGGHFFALFAIASWLIAFNQTVLSWFGLSPSGDLAAASATSYCSVAMLALCRAAIDKNHRECERYGVLLPLAAAFAIAAKLSVAPIALLVILPWFVLGIHRGASFGMRTAKIATACFAAVLTPWVLHSLLSSGCVLYPVSRSCVTWLPWTADKGPVDFASDSIRSWARAPGQPMEWALHGWGWLPFWRKDMLENREFVFTLVKGLPVVLIAALVLRFWLRKSLHDERTHLAARALWLVWAVNLIGLVNWFLSAPDPRFGLGFMLGAIACSAVLIAVPRGCCILDPVRSRAFALIVIGAFAVLLLNDSRLVMALPANSTLMSWRTLPVPSVRYVSNGEGLKIAVPLESDQCWNIQTLCTPEISQRLAKIQIGHLTGFTVRGASVLREIETPRELSGGAGRQADRVRFAPGVGGEETTTQDGKSYSVRWLQQRTEFVIQQDGASQEVQIGFRVASFRALRHVWVEHEGRALPNRGEVRKTFWEGGAVGITNVTTLHPGINRLAIVTDGNAVDVSPGRPVFLLLVGGIDIASLAEQ